MDLKIKTKDIQNLLKFYSDIKISELLKIRRLPYTCPKCNGEGKLKTSKDFYPPNLPDSGYATDIRVVFVECDLCKGEGYTENLYEPMFETKILGNKEKIGNSGDII